MKFMIRIAAVFSLFFCCVWIPKSSAQQSITGGPRGGNRGSVRLLESGRGWTTPSRVWFEANLADNGLGYEGPYATLGAKTHFADDFLDGRWLAEGQANVSLQSGGFFANLGIERVITLPNPGADIVVGGWLDYDGDASGSFSHEFWQVGLNAAIKTQNWDLIGNGYLPTFGTTDYSIGTPGSGPQFHSDRLLLRSGTDSALRGFDLTLRTRPNRFSELNGHFDLGTYGFESDIVEFFYGARARFGAQLWKGWQTTVELNYDKRFDFTGSLQLAYVWGTSSRGTHRGLGNDLERTVRNDHIVRFREDAVFAIDPDTGRAYNVVHVDNTANDNGLGTFESRFNNLAAAQAASNTDDIIFVHTGDGTQTGYDTGIVLKDRQMLLGDGVQHIVPLSGGTATFLPNSGSGNRPILSNPGGSAVTLANGNTIRGINIQGEGTTQFGIFGDGSTASVDGITIEDTNIQGTVLDGISLRNSNGDVSIDRVTVSQTGRHGMNFENIGHSEGTLNFRNLVVERAIGNGFRLDNYDAATVNFLTVDSSSNQGHGISLNGHRNAAGTGAVFTFQNTVTNANGGSGLRLQDAQGHQAFLGISSSENSGNGLDLIDVRQVDLTQQTLITNLDANTIQSNINDNTGIGIFNSLTIAGATQRLNITRVQGDRNRTAIYSQADGLDTQLTTEIVDNISFQNSRADGLVFRSNNGANHDVFVTNVETFAPLNLQNSGAISGNGISLLVDDGTTTAAATLTANIANVDLGNAGNRVGVLGVTRNQGILNANLDGITVQNAVTALRFDFDTNSNLFISRIRAENIDADNSLQAGFDITVGRNSAAYLSLVNSAFNNIEDNQHGSIGARVVSSGLLKLDFFGNTFDQFDQEGIQMTIEGGETLANFDGNTITRNGPLFNFPDSTTTQPPHTDGIDIILADARLDLRLNNNILSENMQRGLDVTTIGSSTINLAMNGNLISGNDVGTDPNNEFESGSIDMSINVFGSTTACLTLSQNNFALQAAIINDSNVALTLELDGATNIQAPVLGGTGIINAAAFGSTCEPAIQVQEAVFTGLGF